tara:strand:- start:131 stop:307 length:177 start_codon:yes stop_codon:yes gene_type:complete
MTVSEVSVKLKVSKHTIRQYIRQGELKAYKLKRQYRIARIDLNEFISNKVEKPLVNIN